MRKKLTEQELIRFEAERDIWQEVLDGVREIKAGGGKRTRVTANTPPARDPPPRVRTPRSPR